MTLVMTVVFVSVTGTVFVVEPVVMTVDVTAQFRSVNNPSPGVQQCSLGHVVVVIMAVLVV